MKLNGLGSFLQGCAALWKAGSLPVPSERPATRILILRKAHLRIFPKPKVQLMVVEYRDRLMRFGLEYIEAALGAVCS